MIKLRWLGAMLGCGVLALTACSRGFVAKAPAGFAEIPARTELRAVSPDGVTFRVRREANKPTAELPFWKEALKKRMLDAGYGLIAERDVKAGNTPGYLLELTAPMGSEDYLYEVAIFVVHRHIVIAESAGEVTRYKARAEDIAAAIGQMTL